MVSPQQLVFPLALVESINEFVDAFLQIIVVHSMHGTQQEAFQVFHESLPALPSICTCN